MFGDRPALSPPEIFYQRMLAGDPTEAAEKAEEFLKERPLSSYYDDVALKGLQLAQFDLDRDALDRSRLLKIRDTVFEFVNDLSDQPDHKPSGEQSTEDAEAVAAVENVAADPEYAELPVLQKADLAPAWQGAQPVLCIAGRTLLDEAAAIMVAQLCAVHGLVARVEGPDALATANIFRLETTGVALVCLSYLDTSNGAHIRYAVRRIRRILPRAVIMVGCWSLDDDAARLDALREATKADLICANFREATHLCVEAAKRDSQVHTNTFGSATAEADVPYQLKQKIV
jgi:hypothetical protein